MSEPLAATSSQLTLFAEAFPVSRIRSLVDDWVPPTTATSGPPSLELFATLDRDGLWQKTYPDCSPLMLDGSSEAFCETWPRAGMTRSGIAYQRPPLAPLTDATASGLWPTPTEDGNYNRKGASAKSGDGLATAVAMWPTPRAEYDSGRHRGRPDTLHSAVKTWPTPTSADGMGGPGSSGRDGGPNLRSAVNGSLNPTWVEWLMGYPLGWTVLKDWATRSSRKSPSGSAAASSPPT